MTHTGKRAGGTHGDKKPGDPILFGQKGAETLIYQRVEPPQQVGKDEVPSSNLGSSSMKNPVTVMVTGFFC